MLTLENFTLATIHTHKFLFELKDWARREIEKLNPKSYEEALRMANHLTDFDFCKMAGDINKNSIGSTPTTSIIQNNLKALNPLLTPKVGHQAQVMGKVPKAGIKMVLD